MSHLYAATMLTEGDRAANADDNPWREIIEEAVQQCYVDFVGADRNAVIAKAKEMLIMEIKQNLLEDDELDETGVSYILETSEWIVKHDDEKCYVTVFSHDGEDDYGAVFVRPVKVL